MLLKDYYQILGLEPGTGAKEIKQAYRQLAHKFHPDKSGEDRYAQARYLEIKEAYETLINPARKEAYLQQRWYQQSMGKKMARTGADTPETLLNKALEINRYAASLNPYRIDRITLKQYLADLLDDASIAILNTFKDLSINEQVALLLLEPAGLLRATDAEEIITRLKKIQLPGDHLEKKANSLLVQLRYAERKKNYEPWLLVLLTVILCVVFFLIGRK